MTNNSECREPSWHDDLKNEIEYLKDRKSAFAPVEVSDTIDDIIERLEEEWSKQTVDISEFVDCPKCGKTKFTSDNFCSRCGYETGFCKHEESGYHQDGRLFCLKCKKKLPRETLLENKA